MGFFLKSIAGCPKTSVLKIDLESVRLGQEGIPYFSMDNLVNDMQFVGPWVGQVL